MLGASLKCVVKDQGQFKEARKMARTCSHLTHDHRHRSAQPHPLLNNSSVVCWIGGVINTSSDLLLRTYGPMLKEDELEEARERRSAEIEFVRSAYASDEAWVDEKETTIHRHLHCSLDGSCIDILLLLTLPSDYLIEETVLDIDATITDGVVGTSSSSCTILRKKVLDALPSLVEACRLTAHECIGNESIFAVLSRADEWLSTDFKGIVERSSISNQINTIDRDQDELKPKPEIALGRRLIHSHHIIAQSKRKAIVELANQHNIGGYTKIGWPGVIIVEGEECDCIAYVDAIRTMRWQHLVVRGEEQVPVTSIDELEEARVLPKKMHEIGDKMSDIAELCKEAGLEELFLTSMKIYSKKESVDTETSNDSSQSSVYGALCHVDHMNDGKGYRKWLRKASSASGCTLLIKTCNSNTKKPVIIVAILGDEHDVKRVLKRWRTSRVDVDGSGKPCLERMMTVLIEGELAQHQNSSELDMDSLDEENELLVSKQCLCDILLAIGGSAWLSEFEQALQR